jgi:hypothetical protein
MKKIFTVLVLMMVATVAVFAKPNKYGKQVALVHNSTEKNICIVVENKKGEADFSAGYINIQPGETVQITTDKQVAVCFGMNDDGVPEDGVWPHFDVWSGYIDFKAPGQASGTGFQQKQF